MHYGSALEDQLRIIMAKEGDGEDFFHAGLPCSVWRSANGAWAGYVGVGHGHPLHGMDAILHPDIDVHGGVTFSNYRNARGSLWWLGFDCWHLHDIIPERVFECEGVEEFSFYRSKDHAERNVRRMAEQIAVLGGEE